MNETKLETWAAPFLTTIPDTHDDSGYTFNAATLPALPPLLSSAGLVIKRSEHTYAPSYRVDMLEWYARRELFSCVGLAIFACAFEQKALEISLTHEETEVLTIIIDGTDICRLSGFMDSRFKLESFEYWPGTITKHPWWPDIESGSPYDLPWFCLTNRDDFVVTEEHWKARDLLRGFGSIRGSLRLAELLLNIGRPSNQRLEVALEGEGGYRGVAPNSTECTFWLPGSCGWCVDSLDEKPTHDSA